jgi:hypothetical protein
MSYYFRALKKQKDVISSQRETEMVILRSDAGCVCYLKTFQAMPWPYRLMDISFILVPVSWTWLASRGEWAALVLAALFWLMVAFEIAIYGRGWAALRRGVQPSHLDTAPNLKVPRWRVIAVGIAFAVVLFGVFLFTPKPERSVRDWRMLLIVGTMFFSRLSSFARARFENNSFEGGHEWAMPRSEPSGMLPPPPRR